MLLTSNGETPGTLTPYTHRMAPQKSVMAPDAKDAEDEKLVLWRLLLQHWLLLTTSFSADTE